MVIIMKKDEIKKSITFKERKRLAILINTPVYILIFFLIALQIYVAFVINNLWYILIGVLTVCVALLPAILYGAYLIKKCICLIKYANNIRCYEVVLGIPIEEKNGKIRFVFQLNNNKFITEWTPRTSFNPPNGYSDSEFRQKKFIVGFYDEKNFILIKERI